MGIFAKWNIFEKAEVLLKRKLRENPFHPFQEVSEGTENSSVYVYSTRLMWFYLALMTAAAVLLYIIIWPSVGGDSEYLVFAVAVFVLSVYLAVEYYSVRRVVFDPANEHYSVYRGSLLIATQHCHNIYIRLLCKKTGSKHPTYSLVLDGYGFEASIKLTGDSTNKKKLRHLGQELAARLWINYFDVHNSSKHHVICHNRPGLAPIDPHEE